MQPSRACGLAPKAPRTAVFAPRRSAVSVCSCCARPRALISLSLSPLPAQIHQHHQGLPRHTGLHPVSARQCDRLFTQLRGLCRPACVNPCCHRVIAAACGAAMTRAPPRRLDSPAGRRLPPCTGLLTPVPCPPLIPLQLHHDSLVPPACRPPTPVADGNEPLPAETTCAATPLTPSCPLLRWSCPTRASAAPRATRVRFLSPPFLLSLLRERERERNN